MIAFEFVLALFYVLTGSLLGCMPCVLLRSGRLASKRGVYFLVLSTVWLLPFFLWVFYSPLSVCSHRIVHSYPTNRTHEDVWESFWCTRPCVSSTVHRPSTYEDLRRILVANRKVRAVGAGHSTSDLQCSDEAIVTTDAFCHLQGVDDDGVATFGAGCSVLQAQELLLPLNRQLKGYGSITTQRLGGAISTSLHGMHTTAFVEHVKGLTAMLANGTLLTVSNADTDPWLGSMGMLGIVLEVRLQTWPVEFVVCSQTIGDVHFTLLDPDVQGFEAFGLSGRYDEFTITVCKEETSHELRDAVFLSEKDSLWRGFLADNVLLDWALYLGGLVPRVPGIDNLLMSTATMDVDSSTAVETVNKYRKPVSFHPHFDEEYSVPVAECKNAMRAIESCVEDDLTVHFYLRRVFGTRGLLTWAPTDSCAIRMEFFRFTSEGVAVETRVRKCVERTLVEKFHGAGHFGKPWYSPPHLLLKNSPQVAAFQAYRQSIDPNGVFENEFTRLLFTSNDTRAFVLPQELDDRLIVWRFAVSFSIVANLILLLGLCRFRGHDDHPVMVVVAGSSSSSSLKQSVPELERLQKARRM